MNLTKPEKKSSNWKQELHVFLFSSFIYIGVGIAFYAGIFIQGHRDLKDFDVYKSWQIDTSKNPIIQDMNKDGLDDLIFKRISGDEIILYGENKGCSFNPKFQSHHALGK